MYGLIPIASIPAQMLWKSTTFNLATTLVLIYICISVHMAQYDRIVEQEKILIQQEHELSMNQMQMMIAQIQPHFLYNSLENAINWGVGQKEDGGTVRITTRENEEQIELCVIDDGVGFDISKMEEQSDGRQHIGVRNARIRFQKMCNGTVDIYSEKGKGTKIRINLPKGGQS